MTSVSRGRVARDLVSSAWMSILLFDSLRARRYYRVLNKCQHTLWRSTRSTMLFKKCNCKFIPIWALQSDFPECVFSKLNLIDFQFHPRLLWHKHIILSYFVWNESSFPFDLVIDGLVAPWPALPSGSVRATGLAAWAAGDEIMTSVQVLTYQWVLCIASLMPTVRAITAQPVQRRWIHFGRSDDSFLFCLCGACGKYPT